VRLTVATGSAAPREVSLKRERVTAPAVTGVLDKSGAVPVGRLQLFEFTRGAGTELSLRTRALLRQGAKGLVLDLRGDPGGLVDEAVRAASVFLPKGASVATTEGAHEPRSVLRARAGAIDGKIPLVVLVNQNSASSSEILSGALRDHGRATLVGTRTFGKAVIQATEVLDNGGALRFTIARYVTPNGLDITARGLIPSVPAVDDPATPKDEAMDRALAIAAGTAPPAVLPMPRVTA
jgi:carboxyl-terminal processing protease